MFDNLIVIIYGFTGRLKNEQVLRKYYWAFIAALGLTAVVITYNSFMSLSYYAALLENFAGMDHADMPAKIVTITIAIAVFFLIAAFTGTVLDFIAGRSERTAGHVPMFVSTILALVLLLSLDIYANLAGRHHVAYNTTDVIQSHKADEIRTEYDAQINAEQSRINAIHKKYTWKGKLYFAATKYHPKPEYDADVKAIDAANSNIQKLRDAQAAAISAELDDYKRNKSRFDSKVNEKVIGHEALVWFAYGIAFLLSFFTSHYTDRAQAHVNGLAPSSSSSAKVGFNTSKNADDAPRRSTGKEKVPSSKTPKNPHTITAQMERMKTAALSNVHEKTRTQIISKNGYEITCAHCGKKAWKKSPRRAKYCSTKCRKSAYNARHPDDPLRI